jgi:hypothetical protein
VTTTISNPSGDRNDKIANAAKVLGRSKARIKVFLAVYTNKKKIKTVKDIMSIAGIKSNVRVLQEAKKLDAENIIKMTKVNGQTGYEKIDFYTHNRKTIINLAKNKEKLKKFPTKTNPQSQTTQIKIAIPKKVVNIKEITIDDIESFSKVKKVKTSSPISTPIAEKIIKGGFQKIIGEKGKFTDWGGETNDLFSSRIRLNGSRKSVAFGFKGKATKGILIPKKLGKNGDQIQRLFKTPAEIFLIQYQGQIDQSVIEQLRMFAIAKSATEGVKIHYGVIDGQDTSRLLKAYPTKFK